MKNLDLLRHVAADMDQLGVDCIFFGGTVVGVHLDQLPPMEEERPTTDVDCVPLAIASYREVQKLDERMTAAGWKHDARPHRRNLYARISPSGVPVDLVPMHSLGEEEPVRLGNAVEVSPRANASGSSIRQAWSRPSWRPSMTEGAQTH